MELLTMALPPANRPGFPGRVRAQILRVMKLTAVFLLALLMHASAKTEAQNITLNTKNASFGSVLNALKKQAAVTFIARTELLDKARNVTVELSNVPLKDALEACFKDQPFTFSMVGSIIILKPRTLTIIRPGATPTEETDSLDLFQPVSGRVTDANGAPLFGASVIVKNSNNSVMTDTRGQFSINLIAGNIITISFVGYESRDLRITEHSLKNGDLGEIRLARRQDDLNETIVVAYSTTTQKKKVSASTVVKGEDVVNLPNRSFERSLQGYVPGLLVTNGNGQPGGGASNVLLRGIGTAIGGSARLPLFVIDGVPITQDMTQSSIPLGSTAVTNPLAQLNMNDFEAFTVLKDASAIALYGSKASNGVILLTTKKGRAGKSTLTLHQQVDFSSIIKDRQPDLLTKQEYLGLLRESYKNANPALWTDAAIDADLAKKFPRYVKAPGDTAFYDPADWAGVTNNKTAITSSTDLSWSGGTDRGVFYLGLSYLDQQGIIRSSGYKRAAIRYNFSNNPLPWLTVGMNSTFTYSRQDAPSTGESAAGPFGIQFVAPSVYPIYLQDGSYYLPASGTPYYNLGNVAAALQWNLNRGTFYRALGDLYMEVKLLKHFSFRADVGGDFMLSQNKSKTDMRLPSSTLQGIGEVTAYDNVRTRLITTNLLRYNNLFNLKHGLEVTLGQEAQRMYSNSTTATSRGFSAPYFEEVSAGSTGVFGVFGTGGSSSRETQSSFFSQATYSYNNRYFATASVRRDGSSRFGANNRFGNYWSFGAGWVISDEAFMKHTSGWLNYLKLRGSIGTAGNAGSLSATARYYLLSLGSNYDGAVAARLSSSPGNPNIKWEKQFSKDLGLEFKLFRNRLGATIDVYHRLTSDLIYTVNLPGSTGYSFGFDNIGNMTNQGIELSLNGEILRAKKFSWSANINWSTNKNKLTKAYQDSRTLLNLVQKVGEPFNSLFLVRWAGVNPANGKPQWYDINGNITETYSPNDRVIVGQMQPKGFGSITNNFRFDRWQLSAFFYYQYGNKLYNDATSYLMNDGAYPYYNQSRDALNRWQKPGDQAPNPRRVLSNPDGGNQISTRYLEDGDFIRLKNLVLSYNFPSAVLKKIRFNNIRVYAQGNNLALWTKYKGIDPENVTAEGSTAFPYPQVKSFSLGIDVTF